MTLVCQTKKSASREQQRVWQAAWRAANRERARATKAAWVKANPDKVKAAHDAWRNANKEQVKVINATYRMANKDKEKARKIAYREANTDKHKAADARYYADNKENEKARSAAYRAANKHKTKVRHAAWAAANKEAIRRKSHNRRARQLAVGGKLSKGLVNTLLKLQKGRCPCCLKKLGKDYHIDHILPLALGGTNTDDNIQLLRPQCNLQKRAQHPIDFMRSRGRLL